MRDCRVSPQGQALPGRSACHKGRNGTGAVGRGGEKSVWADAPEVCSPLFQYYF